MRRIFCLPAVFIAGAWTVQAAGPSGLGFSFTKVAEEAGLTAVTVFGGKETNQYLLETTGCGAAFFDYDGDGWLDVFLVNGTTLEGFPPGQEPTNHLYRNRRDGTFEDVTRRAGLAASGWGQGVCVGDYDNDGDEDLFVTYYGRNRLYRNRGDGTFQDVTDAAGLRHPRTRWGTGCAFLDYDRDGNLDLLVANYIDFQMGSVAGVRAATAAPASAGFCRYKGVPVACGPPGLNGHVYPEVAQVETEAGYRQRKVVYRNLGQGRFEDVSVRLGPPVTDPRAGRGAAFGDYDNDGDLDVVVNNVNEPPDLFRLESGHGHWLLVKLVGTRSNRSAIGARVRCTGGAVRQVQEVRGGGSYMSQNDLRVHFGLGEEARVDRLEVRWPSGLEEEWTGLSADRVTTLKEGTGRSMRRKE